MAQNNQLSNNSSKRNSFNNSITNNILPQKSFQKPKSPYITLDLDANETESPKSKLNNLNNSIPSKTEFNYLKKNSVNANAQYNSNTNKKNFNNNCINNFKNFNENKYVTNNLNKNNFGTNDSFSNEQLNLIFKSIRREPSRPLSREQDNYFISSNNANFNLKNHIPKQFNSSTNNNFSNSNNSNFNTFTVNPETAKRHLIANTPAAANISNQIETQKLFFNPKTTKNFSVSEAKFEFAEKAEKNAKNFYTDKSLIDINNIDYITNNSNFNVKRKYEILNNKKGKTIEIIEAINSCGDYKSINKNNNNFRKKILSKYNVETEGEKSDYINNAFKIPIIFKKSKETFELNNNNNNNNNLIIKDESFIKNNFESKRNAVQYKSLDKIKSVFNGFKVSKAIETQTKFTFTDINSDDFINNTSNSKVFNHSETAKEISKNFNKGTFNNINNNPNNNHNNYNSTYYKSNDNENSISKVSGLINNNAKKEDFSINSTSQTIIKISKPKKIVSILSNFLQIFFNFAN